MKPTRPELARLRRRVLDAASNRPSLSDFLLRMKGAHPDLDAALEGIYCGREGRIAEPVADWGRSICFNWYTTEGRKYVVEYAYLS